jgi:hypothetical protein
MNGTFTSYAAMRMMPAGQVGQQRTIRHDPLRHPPYQAGSFRVVRS